VTVTEQAGGTAAGLLISEAWGAIGQGRYGTSRAAATRAVQAARQLDDPVLLVRALSAEAVALDMLGDKAAALARYTRILGLAEDPATRGRLDDPAAAQEVARAHMNWVESAGFADNIPVRALFGVLDAGENYLQAIGRSQWRAGLLLQRALTHQRLGEWDQAVAFGEEALALYREDAPGFTHAAHRYQLAHILRDAGRPGEAERHYQAALDDPDTVSPHDRQSALQGLAWCALDRDDLAAARRHALAAVREAEPLGDDSLRTALDVAIAVHRAEGDLDASAAAAGRLLETARRLGGHYNLYFAVRAAADVALDRGDLDHARELLGELEEHSEALAAADATPVWARELEQRRQRFSEAEDEP
jgi:tetratricopeptide (TPR) repeat protein